MKQQYIAWFDELRMSDVASVGGKNASLGEMISELAHLGVRVRGGFATTATAYRDFLAQDGLDQRIRTLLDKLSVADVAELAKVGNQIRQWILAAQLPKRLEDDVRKAYQKLQQQAGGEISLAIRSSATAEDLRPKAPFPPVSTRKNEFRIWAGMPNRNSKVDT